LAILAKSIKYDIPNVIANLSVKYKMKRTGTRVSASVKHFLT
jgi:hypothetical protein